MVAAAATVEVLQAGGARSANHTLDHRRWTLPQLTYLSVVERLALWRAGNQLGKALDDNEPVLTPSGWRRMGDLCVGDEVFAVDGTTTRVVAVMPQGTRPMLRLTFDDGATVRCSYEHLWTVKDAEARFRKTSNRYGTWGVMEAGEILARWGSIPRAKQRVSIPVCAPPEHPDAQLPLDPYLLGVLLGDGGIIRATPKLTSADQQVLDEVAAVLPAGVELRRYVGSYEWGISGRVGRLNPVKAALLALGLWGHRSEHKFVPDIYLMASPSQRLALLQGLMDTDGTVTDGGCMTFTSTSARLAEGLVDLVRSLGGKAKTSTRQTYYRDRGDERVPGLPSHRVRIRLPGVDLFRLDRKRSRRLDPTSTTDERVLWSIEPDGEAPCTCITVDHPSRTFITRDYIVTHNSEALAADIVWTARGDHPYREVRPNGPGPVEILVVSYSERQMKPLIWKIWQLLDKREIDPKLSCTKGGGLKGYKDPHITFVAGPGAGSVIYFATYKQGTEALAGPTLDAVFCDEPMSEEVYGELQPRLIRRNGSMRITMTPTPESPPQLWLKEKLEQDREQAAAQGRSPRWAEIQTTINEANLTPQGGIEGVGLAPFKTQAEIDEVVADYLADELPMRRDGAWEAVQSDRMLLNYGDACVIDYTPSMALTWVVAVDHGVKAGRQAALLIGYDPKGLTAYVLDEYRSDGRSSTPQDAKAIAAMLRDNGLNWRQIDYWVGDRAHSGDSRSHGAGKSNALLHRALCAEFDVEQRQAMREGLWIATAGKGAGSMMAGFRLINSMLRTGELLVHARCESVDDSARNWSGKLQDPRKDILDALSYGVGTLVEQHVLFRRDEGGSPTQAIM